MTRLELSEYPGYCPYCGEAIVLLLDGSVDDSSYTEDCSVCCQPILVHAIIGADGAPEWVELMREDQTG